MAIKYNEYLMLELFNSEPIIIDREAEIYKYQMQGFLGLELAFSFSVYDQYVTIRLDHNQLQNPLYDIEIQNVEEIRVEKSKLIVLKQQSKEPVIELNITPNFMLDLSI
ncbi:hypothetical protein [Bacillus sp. KH172YL63]|uniref:hypothetical protein n=1 Tax=Bacillus sp. KH172YL63 TaxID=2709784 RepID=UPI0013E4D9C2|nr:hypothetical protein [Bacillus sp. KH172YL63]BCB02174.1 hypothetical protein KH172YL63_03070 [Bacillus sp. KH172YL63]